MFIKIGRYTALTSVGVALFLCQTMTALAGHYQLDGVSFVDEAERAEYARFQLYSTEDVLIVHSSAAQRNAFAYSTTLSEDRALSIALRCELLQIDGVGPRVSELLTLSGVTGVEGLAYAEASELLATMAEVNRLHEVTGTLPSVELVQSWIQQANNATLIVEQPSSNP